MSDPVDGSVFLSDLRDFLVGQDSVIDPHVIQVSLEAIGSAAREGANGERAGGFEVVPEVRLHPALIGSKREWYRCSVVVDLHSLVGLVNHEGQVIPVTRLNQAAGGAPLPAIRAVA